MRVNAGLFWILAGFFAAASVLYIVWSMIDHAATDPQHQITPAGIEWVGAVAITLSAVLAGLIAFYLTITHRAQGGEMAADLPNAEIDDDDPEIGHFSPWSWWPMVLAFGLALMFLGLATGVWITFIGAPITLLAVVGWQYEYYRNFFAR